MNAIRGDAQGRLACLGGYETRRGVTLAFDGCLLVYMKLQKTVIISNELGLHARAAAKVARLAEGSHSAVFIEKDGEAVDATSVLDVIGLYCPRGSQITVRITDPDDAAVLDEIIRLIETGFGES